MADHDAGCAVGEGGGIFERFTCGEGGGEHGDYGIACARDIKHLAGDGSDADDDLAVI